MITDLKIDNILIMSNDFSCVDEEIQYVLSILISYSEFANVFRKVFLL
jgi:hypothetical protein